MFYSWPIICFYKFFTLTFFNVVIYAFDAILLHCSTHFY